MKLLAFAIAFVFISITTCAQVPAQLFTIKAYLPYWNTASVCLKVNNQWRHTGTVQNDIYSYTDSIDVASNGVLEIRKGKTTVYINLFIEPGTIKIRDRGHQVLEATGTPSNNEYRQTLYLFDSLTKTRHLTTTEKIKQYKKTLVTDYIKNNPQAVVSLQLLYDFFYLDNAIKDSTYFTLYNLLSPELQQTALGKKLSTEAQVSGVTATGVSAVNMVLPDTARQATALFRQGQVTLIDFWASWCWPCRRESPALVALFNKYQALGFTITSVSLDTNSFLWKQAITKDKMTWQHVSDLGGWNGVAASTYGIKTIPANFLIDQNGHIIGSNLSFGQLDVLLSKLLSAKAF